MVNEDIEALAASPIMWEIIWDDLPIELPYTKYSKRVDQVIERCFNSPLFPQKNYIGQLHPRYRCKYVKRSYKTEAQNV